MGGTSPFMDNPSLNLCCTRKAIHNLSTELPFSQHPIWSVMGLIFPLLPDIISAIERVLPCCQESSHFLRRRNRRGGLPVLQNGLRVLQKFLADLGGVLRLLFILRQSEGGFPAAADAAATAPSLRATLFGWLAIAIAASASVLVFTCGKALHHWMPNSSS